MRILGTTVDGRRVALASVMLLAVAFLGALAWVEGRRGIDREQDGCSLTLRNVGNRIRGKPRMTRKQATGRPAAPRVDAEVVDAKASPDRACIALSLVRTRTEHRIELPRGVPRSRAEAGTAAGRLVRRTLSRQTSLALLDPKSRRIVAEHPVSDAGELVWSPDSRRVAALSGPETLALLDRGGELRFAALAQAANDFVWNPRKPGHLLYRSDGSDGRDTIREYSTSTDSDRKLMTEPDIAGIFVVGDEPCVAYVDERHDAMRVVGIDTRRVVLTIPFHGRVQADGYWCSLSPDGHYFRMGWWISGSVIDVVARAEDAASVLLEPHKSVLYQESHPLGGVLWPQSDKDSPWGVWGGPHAFILSDWGDPGFLLNLTTGGRTSLSGYERRADFYGVGRTLLVLNGGTVVRDLAGNLVADAGVIIRDYTGDDVLLRHTVPKPADGRE